MSIRVAVRRLPNKNEPCLVIEEGNERILVATFVNEVGADFYQRVVGGDMVIEGKTLGTIQPQERE